MKKIELLIIKYQEKSARVFEIDEMIKLLIESYDLSKDEQE